jgi:type IX secretion system PorP/SprF family membrane protein
LKKLFIITHLITILFIAKAQDSYVSYTYNRYLITNPAEAGTSEYTRLSAVYRNQWPAFGNSFATYAAGFDSHFSKSKASLGVSFLYDRQGSSFSKGNFGVIYAYRIIDKNKMKFQAGLQAGLQQWSRTGSTLTDANGNRDVITGKTYIQPDFAFGICAFNRNFNSGIAIQNLNTGYLKFNQDFHSSSISLTAYYMPKIRYYTASVRNNEYIFTPLLLASIQPPYTIIQYGLIAEHKGLEIGAGLRHKQFMPASVIGKIGVYLGNLKITYNYDFNMQSVTYPLPMSECHEIGLIYYFIDNERKKPTGPVKCPNIDNSSW